MRSPMDETSFLRFYANTLLGYSKGLKRNICNNLEEKRLITFDTQQSLEDPKDILFFEKKSDFENVIQKTSMDKRFTAFYELSEFKKLYRYSVPLFYKNEHGEELKDLISKTGAKEFVFNKYIPDYILDEEIKDALPLYWVDGDVILLKFVLQKMYYQHDSSETVEYRYPIVVCITEDILEIRFDALRYIGTMNIVSLDTYEKLVSECILWLQNKLGLSLYKCDHADIIKVINDRNDTSVVMYKQMMELSSGGAAELTASENTDYVLPFVGEIRELIEENEEIFNQSDEIKKLLLQYLEDKEATASYPYIYIKWKKPVVSQSYVVKVTFDYLQHEYTLLQHNTGDCKNFEMERMNDAIKYLCTSGSFVRGEKI